MTTGCAEPRVRLAGDGAAMPVNPAGSVRSPLYTTQLYDQQAYANPALDRS